MDAKKGVSTKHVQVDKANARVVIFVSIAAFVLTFSLFATKALLSQRSYQAKLITEKSKARSQLDANIKAVAPLTEAYKQFVDQQVNVIGGVPNGIGNQDGDNAKIILDALPSKYDFPAMVSSLDKLLKSNNFRVDSIQGTDDELNQQSVTANGLVEMPFQVTIIGNYAGAKEAISLMERSIRPFQIDSLTFAGGDNDMNLQITGKTYYQPEKTVKITTKEVK